MQMFNGKTICGKRGGKSHLWSFRVDPETNKCPVVELSDETVVGGMTWKSLKQFVMIDDY